MSSQSVQSDTRAVHIPITLYELVEQQAKESDFASAEEYIIFALTELTRSEEPTSEASVLSEEDESKIMDRLRGLGYIE
jgi:hypothetical protein